MRRGKSERQRERSLEGENERDIIIESQLQRERSKRVNAWM